MTQREEEGGGEEGGEEEGGEEEEIERVVAKTMAIKWQLNEI